MEELEVLIKKQEEVEKDINSYESQIKALSSSITNLKDQKQDFRYTYTVLKEEYDKVKDSTNDADKQKAQELRDKMAETSVEYKNISNNLDSETKELDYIKEVLDFTKTKNDNLKEQIVNHPETKVVETTQLEKELQQKLDKAKKQKNEIEEGLNKEIKSIKDIDHSLIAIIENNPSYERYVNLLLEENEHLDSLEKSDLDDKFKDKHIEETKNKINSLKSRQLAFVIDELRKESLKQDIIIDTAYDHIKELARSKAVAYDEIDSMRNGKVDQNSKDDKNDTGNDSDKDKDQDQNQEKNDKDNNTEKDNANDSSNQNNNKDEDENKNKKIDDDTETKAGKPAKRSFFKKIFSKASEIINKIKDRLPKSKAKKEQEQKEAEEKAKKEQEQKEAEEKARKEQEQKEAEEKAKKEQEQKEAEEKARKEQEQKEAEEKAKKEQEQKKYKNRHYDEHDFDDNEIYKKRVDEYLNNFEKKVKNAHKEAVRYREEHEFDDQNLN